MFVVMKAECRLLKYWEKRKISKLVQRNLQSSIKTCNKIQTSLDQIFVNFFLGWTDQVAATIVLDLLMGQKF